MVAETIAFKEPWDVLLAAGFTDRARLKFLKSWRRIARASGDAKLARQLAFAIIEVQRELDIH